MRGREVNSPSPKKFNLIKGRRCDMKNKLWLLYPVFALLLAFSLAVPASASGVVPLPHNFYGSVTIGTEPAPAGTEIEASGAGVMTGIEGNPLTTTEAGAYGGSGPLDPKLRVQGYIAEGTPIEFYIGEARMQCREHGTEAWLDSYPWHSDGRTELDLTVGGDTTNPTVVISSTASDPTNTSPIPMTATFSETVTGFVVGDIIVGNGAAGNFVVVSGLVYTFSVTPVAAGEVTVDIAAGVAIDAATNPNEAATQFSITYSINPTVVISTTASDPTDISPIPMTATFSEDVTGFELVDIIVGNGAAGNFVAVSGLVYTFSVTPVAEGEVTVDIAAGVAQDAATNPNEAATQFSIIYSTETFTITATAGDNGTISPSDAVVVNSGASQAFTITPNAGYAVDDVLVDGISVGAVSSHTFANVTADHTIHADFVEVTGDLGDLIDEALDAGEDTLVLGAGTYTGDVTISQPITITGTEGETIIHGGIHVVPLVGSNVTIENLTITDYTAYGIRIELVGADDVFTIRNNTIEGVEGSLIGIKVDEVEGLEVGGALHIVRNTIKDNEVGIELQKAVKRANIAFNNIDGNEVGLKLLAVGEHRVSASVNWWGDISGPEEQKDNPGGIGDKIELTDGLGYSPWLTREFQTVLDDNIAYFGFPMVELNKGWNIISTPIALDPDVEWVDSKGTSRTGVNTWGDYIALGDGLDIHDTNPAYRFDAQTQGWVLLTSDSALKPCDAIYVRMTEPDIAPILFSPNVSVPSKELYSGWNLVGLAWLPPRRMGAVYGMSANDALVTVEEVTGALPGYKLVVSLGMGSYERSWIHIAGDTIEPWTDPNDWPPPDGHMFITSGYWVFMLNDGTLAGFTFTPISLPEPPPPGP